MADEALKQFLRQQARSLDSLLELTPAKNMFGEDVSDQWKRKKQTPEQKKAARMAKLDPANWKSAKDVYDERAVEATKKRKRDEDQHDLLQDGGQTNDASSSKKRRTDNVTQPQRPATIEKIADAGEEGILNKNLRKKLKKRASRKVRSEQDRQRKEAKKEAASTKKGEDDDKNVQKAKASNKGVGTQEKQQGADKPVKSKSSSKKDSSPSAQKPQFSPINGVEQQERQKLEQSLGDDQWSNVEGDDDSAGEAIDRTGETDRYQELEQTESTASSSEGIPDILSPPQESAASSVSSILPPTIATTKVQPARPKPQEKTKMSDTDVQQSTGQPESTTKTTMDEPERLAARQRLQEHIESLRTQRKADEKPPRSRAELLEQRKRKDEERKAAKKAQRQKEKEEEAIRQDEEMARRFSPGGSGSLLGSPRSPIVDTEPSSGGGYSYGRIAFEDGTSLDPNSLSDMKERKHKGPQDAATALKAAEAKQARLAGLDEVKRAGIAEKDMWLNARKRAHGEKVRDDQSLLKKALKRQEKQKSRSGTEWDNRIEGVRSAQEAKQKKRTENLQKRKDEKFAKKTGASKKKIKRPGFEGSFRGRTGKGKK